MKFGKVEILRPKRHTAASGLPETIGVTLVVGREVNPPEGEEPALWLLLTTHQVNDGADARRIIGFYRLRWTIEQLFRTMKTKGFDVEALSCKEEDGARKTVAAPFSIAAVKVMQLVDEREGKPNACSATLSTPMTSRPWSEFVEPPGQTASKKIAILRLACRRRMGLLVRLGGWTSYDGKPGRIVTSRPHPVPRHVEHGMSLRNV